MAKQTVVIVFGDDAEAAQFANDLARGDVRFCDGHGGYPDDWPTPTSVEAVVCGDQPVDPERPNAAALAQVLGGVTMADWTEHMQRVTAAIAEHGTPMAASQEG